jgi:hypothetical protein
MEGFLGSVAGAIVKGDGGAATRDVGRPCYNESNRSGVKEVTEAMRIAIKVLALLTTLFGGYVGWGEWTVAQDRGVGARNYEDDRNIAIVFFFVAVLGILVYVLADVMGKKRRLPQGFEVLMKPNDLPGAEERP